MENFSITNDTWTYQADPDTVTMNVYGSNILRVGGSNYPNNGHYTYIELPITSDVIYLNIYCTTTYGTSCNYDMDIYNTTVFDQTTLTWNNQPAMGSYITTHTITAGWNSIALNSPDKYIVLTESVPTNTSKILWSSRASNGFEPYIALPTPANIGATNIEVIPSETPCIVGTCTISVGVTWKNTGDLAGSSDLSITIDGGTHTVIPTVYPSELFDADEEKGPYTFTISNVTKGTYSICPNPN